MLISYTSKHYKLLKHTKHKDYLVNHAPTKTSEFQFTKFYHPFFYFFIQFNLILFNFILLLFFFWGGGIFDSFK